MARQRVDASLDAFDALIADLADAGEIAPSEVSALRDQAEIPQTSEIPVQALNRWDVMQAVAAGAPAVPEAPAAGIPAVPAKPMTRREARALREAEEALAAAGEAGAESSAETTVESAVEAENVRRTEELIHSHRVRPEGFDPKPAAAVAAPRPKRRSARRSVLAGVGAIVLIPSLWIVVPATADTTPGPATVGADGHTAQQIMQIAEGVQSPTISSNSTDYVASAIAAIVAKEGGATAEAAQPAIVDALSAGGNRAKIVETALSYIGTPYVLGDATHQGIDCSGLTMVAYAAIGISLAHYVPTQDAVGTRIPETEAKPGDLVVFDNEDHVGIYLGDDQVLAAPAPGRRVSIESVDLWRPIGIHFTRILPAGQ